MSRVPNTPASGVGQPAKTGGEAGQDADAVVPVFPAVEAVVVVTGENAATDNSLPQPLRSASLCAPSRVRDPFDPSVVFGVGHPARAAAVAMLIPPAFGRFTTA